MEAQTTQVVPSPLFSFKAEYTIYDLVKAEIARKVRELDARIAALRQRLSPARQAAEQAQAALAYQLKQAKACPAVVALAAQAKAIGFDDRRECSFAVTAEAQIVRGRIEVTTRLSLGSYAGLTKIVRRALSPDEKKAHGALLAAQAALTALERDLVQAERELQEWGSEKKRHDIEGRFTDEMRRRNPAVNELVKAASGKLLLA
jgi:predicted RNase H-like nuclease (RuvC/YqgF family)